MNDKAQDYSHPNFGHQIRVEQQECEVALVFVADDIDKATELADHLLAQLQAGSLELRVGGKPIQTIKECTDVSCSERKVPRTP